MPRQRACETDDRLARLLDDRLPAVEEAALISHLDTCPACRERLDRLSASDEEWSEFRDYLAGESLPQPACGIPETGFSLHPLSNDAQDVRAALHFLGPTDDPEMLGRLGPYEVSAVIGYGAMGIVLKAHDRSLNRYVAVKVLAPQLATSAVARRRFAREAQAAAAVVHENVVAIHAVAEANGLPYLVMPYLAGRSLQHRIDEQGPMPLPSVLRVGIQAARGLAAAHAQGLIHRDIKPGNILLEGSVERLVITDFGLARAIDDASLTQSGVIAGTPQYMSPEQARGEPLDHRADLFSLGSVMYAMCTSRPPFRAQTALAVLRRICEDEPPQLRDLNPDIPEWLEEIIARLHAKSPDDRSWTAEELADLLERHLAHVQRPLTVPQPPRLKRLQPFLHRRHRFGRPAAMLLAGAIASGAWIGAAAWIHRSSEEPDTSTTAVQPLGTVNDTSAEESEEPPVPVAEYTPADERAWQETLSQATQAVDRLEAGWPIEQPPSDQLMQMAAEVEADLLEIERRHAAPP